MLLEAPWDPSLNEYAAPRLSKLTREGAWDSSEVLASVLNDNGGVALKVELESQHGGGVDGRHIFEQCTHAGEHSLMVGKVRGACALVSREAARAVVRGVEEA